MWMSQDNPGPAHCIECAATISTVMPVNNAYSWNPLRWLLTVCGGGLEPRPGSFLDDCKWHQRAWVAFKCPLGTWKLSICPPYKPHPEICSSSPGPLPKRDQIDQPFYHHCYSSSGLKPLAFLFLIPKVSSTRKNPPQSPSSQSQLVTVASFILFLLPTNVQNNKSSLFLMPIPPTVSLALILLS